MAAVKSPLALRSATHTSSFSCTPIRLSCIICTRRKLRQTQKTVLAGMAVPAHTRLVIKSSSCVLNAHQCRHQVYQDFASSMLLNAHCSGKKSEQRLETHGLCTRRVKHITEPGGWFSVTSRYSTPWRSKCEYSLSSIACQRFPQKHLCSVS